MPRGGCTVAVGLSQMAGIPLQDALGEGCLIVDDMVDSGGTRSKYRGWDFACLHVKTNTPSGLWPEYFVHKINSGSTSWIEYFWEVNESSGIEDSIIRSIEFIGDDPNREGLIETPLRVANAMKEIYSGYGKSPKDLLKTFDADGYDQLIMVKNIELYSTCEHHMLPFIGRAHVGYIPSKKVVGVSKIARLVDLYSRRLQIQERLTDQITSAIDEWLDPIGVACVIEAQHLCMRMRGVAKQNSSMLTSSLKGVFLEDSNSGRAAKAEFMQLIQ